MTSLKGLTILDTEGSSKQLLPSVHFFNPGYEATLEKGLEHFTPSASVLHFREDCALLPLYLPESSGRAILPGSERMVYSSESGSATSLSPNDHLHPWGWAPELKGLFPEHRLPYSSDEMRYLGSRLRSVELWQLVYAQSPHAFEANIISPKVIKETPSFDKKNNERWVIKSEFSSSGRGVQFAENNAKALGLIEKKRGKSTSAQLILEPWLNAQSDRGYEFHRTSDGTITYLGGSDFRTVSGRYVGNRLIPSRGLEEEWDSLPTSPTHENYVQILTQALETLDLGTYSGLLGVDTMVYIGHDRQLYISPCIELNIRPTMGHIALELSSRYIGDKSGFFSIEPLSTDLHFSSRIPLFQLGVVPTPGLYTLVPITANTRFVACLRIDDI